MKLVERKGMFTYDNDKVSLVQSAADYLLTSRLEISPDTRYVFFNPKSETVISNWIDRALEREEESSTPSN